MTLTRHGKPPTPCRDREFQFSRLAAHLGELACSKWGFSFGSQANVQGVCRSEACEMRWDQINGDRWAIPETKNGKSHVVTLHPLTLSILKKRIISEGAYVFESTSNPGFAITGDAVTRALERLRKKYLGELATFSPHDLRRSVAIGCAEYLDAPERLIELLLNHLPADRMIRTYQVGQRAEKLRNLFMRRGDFVEHEVSASRQPHKDNVVTLKFGAK